MYILPYNNTLFLASSYSPALFLSLTTVPPSLKAHRLIINRYPAKSPRQPHNKKVLNSADLCLPHTPPAPCATCCCLSCCTTSVLYICPITSIRYFANIIYAIVCYFYIVPLGCLDPSCLT